MIYTTQMDAARRGIITEEMRIVAQKEHLPEEQIRAQVAEGTVIIPCNKLHRAISPNGVGASLRTKINVNLGTSRDVPDVNIDPEKARAYRESAKPQKEDTCSMCGNFCAVKNVNRILDGEIVSIYDE